MHLLRRRAIMETLFQHTTKTQKSVGPKEAMVQLTRSQPKRIVHVPSQIQPSAVMLRLSGQQSVNHKAASMVLYTAACSSSG